MCPAGLRGQASLQWLRGWSPAARPRWHRNARIAGSSTRSIATRTTTSSPTCRPIRKSCAILPRWYSPTRRWRTRRSIRTCSSRSPIILAQCTGKRVVYYPVQSNSAEIEAMRSGRLHVAGFSTGPTGFAVNMAGAVPFAAKGTEKGPQGYHLLSIVKKRQPLSEARGLEGQARRAHIALVEFRQSRAARALSAGGPQAERGLQAADVGRARQIGARRRVRRLRHGRRRFRRVRADDHARHAEGG